MSKGSPEAMDPFHRSSRSCTLGRWSPWGILGGALLFSLAQAFQLSIQVGGIRFPYEFAVMLPDTMVVVVLALARKSRMLGPAALGKPYDREMRA